MKRKILLLVLMFLPIMANASMNNDWDKAKQKMAPLYKYANRYENKLKGDDGILYFDYINNPDSLADLNIEADLKKYIMLVGQELKDELSIPRELYNPDIEVEISSTDVFYYKSNTVSYYRVGAGTKSVAFDNDVFSNIVNKYGRVSCNDFYCLTPPAPTTPPVVEIKLQGNTPSASEETRIEQPAQVMSGKYDIMVVMVPYWYKIIAESETVDTNFLDPTYIDSLSAISKMSFVGKVRYNNNADKGKDDIIKSSAIEYDGKKVDTLIVFEDFEFPYSYKDLSYSYPTLIIEGATRSVMAKQGFLYSLCIDRVIMRSKESGEDIVIAPEVVASYSKDQMATIILPTEPDASKGKYYRLDRCEKGKIIFEEELSPKARTPYIIVPKEDFSIDLNALDLDGLLRDTVSVKGASFIGSYCHEELSCQDGFYIDIIDATPDCQADDSNQRKAIVGALRACLIVSWDDPYNPGGSKGITVKREIVLKDNPNGIESLIPDPSPREKGTIYDLSGRKVNSQFSILNSQLKQKGLYIKDGKKIIVK